MLGRFCHWRTLQCVLLALVRRCLLCSVAGNMPHTPTLQACIRHWSLSPAISLPTDSPYYSWAFGPYRRPTIPCLQQVGTAACVLHTQYLGFMVGYALLKSVCVCMPQLVSSTQLLLLMMHVWYDWHVRLSSCLVYVPGCISCYKCFGFMTHVISLCCQNDAGPSCSTLHCDASLR